MRPNPKPQEIYRHFKGNVYQIITIARHSETKVKMVVYQQLYAPYEVYVRPLDMFMSKIDTYKYPNEKQKYRFEKLDIRGEDKVDSPKETSAETLSRILNRGKKEMKLHRAFPKQTQKKRSLRWIRDLSNFLTRTVMRKSFRY